MADFFSIGTTHPHHSDDITKDFVKNLSAGSIFKWKEDPTETIYTIEDQTACKNFCRFGRSHAGKHNGQSNHNFAGTEILKIHRLTLSNGALMLINLWPGGTQLGPLELI
jgi:hypothetical protein